MGACLSCEGDEQKKTKLALALDPPLAATNLISVASSSSVPLAIHQVPTPRALNLSFLNLSLLLESLLLPRLESLLPSRLESRLVIVTSSLPS